MAREGQKNMADSRLVKWQEHDEAGTRWMQGEWRGQHGRDGSLTVYELELDGPLRGLVRCVRSLRPHRVQIASTGPRGGVVWAPFVKDVEWLDGATRSDVVLVSS